MKRNFLLFIFCLSALLLSGCHAKRQAVEVIIEGNEKFPEILAGTWKSDNDAWVFNIKPDGKIAWAIISLGSVKIEPGKIVTVPMRMGGEGVFKAGQWTVMYIPKQHELTVEIAIDYFRTELGKDIIHGKTRDIFSGNVSPDGKIWWTDRYSYPEYIVNTEKFHEYKLPEDPNENPKENLLFRKVEK